ncbi:MAG: hypothetical protein A3F68_13105 [Acidobacteria bacterium RIFCSPLOWO2_12_FULL_54_10]|nr:MAG: hypothetical protein A3F68_13105 [Acidobacteria bacterium RIFCSPLOWO2_12_FULL_54_10]
MRIAEWINVGALLGLMLLAMLRPIPFRRKCATILPGLCGLGLLSLVILLDSRNLSVQWAMPVSVMRDLLPLPLLMIVYWQAGRLACGISPRFQQWALSVERWWRRDESARNHTPLRQWTGELLELAYLSCYVMVPAAFILCYSRHGSGSAEWFWSVVLAPTYFCYLLVPFFPHDPPRVADAGRPEPSASRVRQLNLWILERGSIGVNTFPSAHVASSVAAALAILPLDPQMGAALLLVALGIAVAVVARRYHYTVDSFGGVAAAVAAFLYNYLT